MNLFVYGTLQFEPVMRAVSGYWATPLPATLDDHARYRVAGEIYPGVVPVAGGCVDGAAFSNLPDAVMDRIDAFEPPMYRRIDAPIRTSQGELRAGVYVVRARFRHRLSGQPWDPDDFARRFLETFLTRRVRGGWD